MTKTILQAWSLWAATASLFLSIPSRANLIISEIAYQGSVDVCDGEDWVELYNSGVEVLDLTGYVLHDSKGISDPDTFTFPPGSSIDAESYLLLCHNQVANASTASSAAVLSPQFGIGDDDTLTLARVDGTTVAVLSVVGPFPGSPNPSFLADSFALDPDTAIFNYTATPTPGAINVMTPLPSAEELANQRKTEMAVLSDAGIDFFNMDRQGMPVASGMDTILELKITMDANDYDAMKLNPQYQEYYPFETATVLTKAGDELVSLESPGRIRARGGESIYLSECLGDASPLPFRLDFDDTDQTQTLYGIQRLYLRPPIQDPSYMREWVYPRMLARFGLPHARTRMVHFYINDNLEGFYTLMEQPEEEYVFARSFSNYDPSNFAFFQVDELTEGCGLYSENQLAEGRNRVGEFSTPPYVFERGDHVPRIGNLGEDKFTECKEAYSAYYDNVLMEDVVLAYVRNDELCINLFLGEGLVQQELGTDNWDNELEKWIDNTMTFNRCDETCSNSIVSTEANLENFLKTFAFWAVTLTMDSPMGNVNNHYLAQEESDQELWNLFSYSFGKPGSPSCFPEVCNSRLVSWSISRPTCESLQSNNLVGPLLTQEEYHSQYIEHIREFMTAVYANQTFIKEIQDHASAIEEAVKASFGGGASFDEELSPDAADWNTGNLPLLPTMKARAAEVQKQLDALADGTFARGPHAGATADNEPWEICADWQSSEPDTSACKEGCKYEGCHTDGWTVPSFCDEATGTCYHGDVDSQCAGVGDGGSYSGMEARNGMDTFCRFAAGVPVKTSVCPDVGAQLGSSSTTSGSAPRTCLMVPVMAMAMAMAALGQLWLDLVQ